MPFSPSSQRSQQSFSQASSGLSANLLSEHNAACSHQSELDAGMTVQTSGPAINAAKASNSSRTPSCIPSFFTALTKKRDQRQLTDSQAAALGRLETAETLRHARLTNADVDYPLRAYIEQEKPALKDKAFFQEGLKRTASFLLIRPICEDLAQTLRDREGVAPNKPFSSTQRELFTAQVDALKRNIDTNNQAAMHSALQGERCCPLSLQKAAFAAFLAEQKQSMHQVISACSLSGDDRRQALTDALAAIAYGYLAKAGCLPTGLDVGSIAHEGTYTVDHARLSVLLVDEQHCGSVHKIEKSGDVALLFIGIDGLAGPLDDPLKGTSRSRMYVSGFESYPLPQKQAGVYLQKLLMELVNIEEQMYVKRNTNKDGSPMHEVARTTKREIEYEGTTHLGDCVPPPGPASGLGSRIQLLEAFTTLRSRSLDYQEQHSQFLLEDPALEHWLNTQDFFRDAMSLNDPPSRLKLALLAPTASALRESGVLD